MKKEFIAYKEALDLKELGFNEKTFSWYLNEKDIQFGNTGNIGIDKARNIDLESIGCVTAPLYQQAFRWFREKHGLQCYPMLDTEDIYWCLFSDGIGSGFLMKNGDYGYFSEEHLEFKTYEEAEAECLKKLIEVVKSAQKEFKNRK